MSTPLCEPGNQSGVPRKSRRWILVAITGVVGLGVLILATRSALVASREAEDLRAAVHASQTQLAESQRQRALVAIDDGDTDWGLLWLAEARKNFPPGPSERREAVEREIAEGLLTRRTLLREFSVPAPLTGFYESQDGRRAFLVSQNSGQVYDISGNAIGPRIESGSTIQAAVFSPDGSAIAVAGVASPGKEESVRIWPVDGRDPGRRVIPIGESHLVQALGWHGNQLVIGVYDPRQSRAEIRFHDPRNLMPLGLPLPCEGQFAAIDCDGDRWIVFHSINHSPSGGRLTQVSAAAREVVGRCLEVSGFGPAVSSPSSLRVFRDHWRTVSGGYLRTWDPATGVMRDARPIATGDAYVCRGVSHRWLMAEGRAVRSYGIAGGVPVEPALHHTSAVAGVLSDGRTVLSASSDGLIRVWGEIGTVAMQTDAPVRKVAVSHSGQFLAAVGSKGNVLFHNRQSRATFRLAHEGPVTAVVWCENPPQWITASGSALFHWKVQDGAPIPPVERSDGVIREIVFDPSSKACWIVSQITPPDGGKAQAVLTRMDPSCRRRLGNPITVAGTIYGFHSAGDRGLVLAIQRDHAFFIETIDPEGRTIQTSLFSNVQLSEYGRVAFAVHGSWVAAPGHGEVRVWLRDTGKTWSYPVHHGDRITAVMSHPGSERLIAGGASGRVSEIALAADQFTWQHRNGGDAVTQLAALPNGHRLIAAGRDGIVRQWQMTTGRPIGPRLYHSDAVTCLTATSDSRFIVTGCADGTVRVWPVFPELPETEDLPGFLQRLTGLKLP